MLNIFNDLHVIAIATIAVCAFFLHWKYNEKSVTIGPTFLTTLGIFATFIGISLGLYNFDTSNIQNSIPELINGLKTAFFASAAGIFGALTIKIRHFFHDLQSDDANGMSSEITAQDLARLLKGIQEALVGKEDSSLISQLKLSRSDSNDRLDALKQAQIDALQKLSEMGSKQLVEALRDVIKDFNTKITEQFGENFKQLNEAVGRMLVWQEQYKQHIEQASIRHQAILESMATSSEHYKDLVNKAGIFSKISEDLLILLRGLETQKIQLTESLKSLAELLLSASGSLPKVEEKIMELTQQMTSAVKTNQQEINRSILESTKNSQSALESQQKEINLALSENVKLIRTSIQNVGEDFNKINQEFNKKITETSDKIKQQVAILDKALAEELEKSLESLGRQLAALSEKFVSDYTPLTEKLRALVQVSRAL